MGEVVITTVGRRPEDGIDLKSIRWRNLNRSRDYTFDSRRWGITIECVISSSIDTNGGTSGRSIIIIGPTDTEWLRGETISVGGKS